MRAVKTTLHLNSLPAWMRIPFGQYVHDTCLPIQLMFHVARYFVIQS